MKRKITYLVWGCAIAMIALCSAQGYFIYNTYQLKKRDAQAMVREALIDMEEHIKIDSLRTNWFATVENTLQRDQYHRAVKLINERSASLSNRVEQYIATSELLSKFDVAYRVEIRHVAIKDTSQRIRHFTGIVWVSTKNVPERPLVIHDLNMDSESADALIRNFKTRSLFSIGTTGDPILWEMAGLLLFSGILLATVILLFYFSIRSLVTQKKIADMQNDFINNISHEFNTPLAALGIGIRTLSAQSQPIEDPISDHALAVISRQYHRLKKLIEQVMQYTVGSQQLALQKQTTNPTVFLTNLIEDFQLAFPEVAITLYTDPTHNSVELDPFQLTTALTNMLENAVKYGGTKITCTANLLNDTFNIAIQDNGQGIPKTELHRIFEKFYRIEKGDIHNVKGLGLGLYYANRVALAHHGRIQVASTPGKGSTFTLIIPLQ